MMKKLTSACFFQLGGFATKQMKSQLGDARVEDGSARNDRVSKLVG